MIFRNPDGSFSVDDFLNAKGMIPQLLNYVVDAKSQEERLSYLFHMRLIEDGMVAGTSTCLFCLAEEI